MVDKDDDDDGDKDSELPYLSSEGSDKHWTDEAYKLLKAGSLHVEVSQPKNRKMKVQATGACPRCGHDVAYEFFERITGPAVRPGFGDRVDIGIPHIQQLPDPYQDVTILCWCHTSHPGAPADQRGCGVAFTTSVWRGSIG